MEENCDTYQVFDWELYLKEYPDLTQANIVSIKDVIDHMITYGLSEERNLFDINGNRYIHSFKKDLYQRSVKKTFNTDASAYLHWYENYIHINKMKAGFYSCDYDFDSTSTVNNTVLDNVYKNIDHFSEFLKPYKNILFLCSDYPGYGGAATNCENIANYYKSTHNVYSVYWNWDYSHAKHYHEDEFSIIIDKYELSPTLRNLKMKPDIIILKNTCDFNIKSIFNCPFVFLIPGIYKNDLDMSYTELDTIELQNKYINTPTLEQIKRSDYSFCNSVHVKEILKKWYDLDVGLFCSSFVPYYGKMINDDPDFLKRKYDYGLVVSDFTRKVKNVEKSIAFLKGKQNVVLIGKGASKYKQEGFTCIELVDRFEMSNYYKQIKYIVQDSHFEACSNVRIEGIFKGCIIIGNKNGGINTI